MPITPAEKHFQDFDSFSSWTVAGQIYPRGLPKTTSSLTGSPSYATTSYTVSDILQGTFATNDPSDQLLVINTALTRDLTGLYNKGLDRGSSFNATASEALYAGDAAGGGLIGPPYDPAAPGSSSAPQVKESWVRTLPKTHPTSGAFLWISKGRASNEMHLPTSEDLATDIRQHMQASDLPEKSRHPWYMDRAASYGQPFNTNPVIGSDGYVKYWEGGESILGGEDMTKTKGNEDPNIRGQNGAFGYLDPASEQYYISMWWAYGTLGTKLAASGYADGAAKAPTLKQSDYRGKKILVYSVDTGRSCVCTPGEVGPRPDVTKSKNYIAGLAVDVHWVLGTSGITGPEVQLGWMPDNTPLGPYMPTVSQALDGTTSGGNVVIPPGSPPPIVGTVRSEDFVRLALAQNGDNYVFNTGNINDPDPNNFDCSGLVYWAATRCGYRPPAGTPSDWSYSGIIIEMFQKAKTEMSIADAVKTRGAILCKRPGTDYPGAVGHVAISLGDGKTIEAKGTKWGVGIFNAMPRNWTSAGYLPGMSFGSASNNNGGTVPR